MVDRLPGRQLQLQSKRGNREQYQNMVNTCHVAGVKVIAGMSISIFTIPTVCQIVASSRCRVQPLWPA